MVSEVLPDVSASSKRRVATRICKEEPCALYIHCYGHSFNFNDAMKGTKVMKNKMETAHESIKLVKHSLKDNFCVIYFEALDNVIR